MSINRPGRSQIISSSGIWGVLLVLAVLALTGMPAQAAPLSHGIKGKIHQLLGSGRKSARIAGRRPITTEIISRFYRERGYRPVWLNTTGLKPLAEEVVRAIQLSRFDGLQPSDYHIRDINMLKRKVRKTSASKRISVAAALDILITDAFLAMTGHLRYGKIDTDISPFYGDRGRILVDSLKRVLKTGRIFTILENLRPKRKDFQSLRQSLIRYLRIEEKGGWQSIPIHTRLEWGDQDDNLPLVRKRLALTGDLEWAPSDEGGIVDTFFDEDLEDGLRRFQRRHRLRRTGVLDSATLAALNVSLERRILQIRLNMDLRRHLLGKTSRRYLVVNVPSMELQAFREAKEALKMTTIVGRADQQTPIFSDEVTLLIIHPYWYIPPEIIEEDILPGVRRDPDYLASRGIRLFRKMSSDRDEVLSESVDWQTATSNNLDFYFRQDPGRGNSLGKIKFVMQNRDHIYLHDTPSRDLFGRSQRALSHGCVRVEKPLDLAAFMLEGHDTWTRHRLGEMMKNGRQKTIQLQIPVAVHIVYWTVTIDRRNRPQFLPDIYGLEPRLISRLTS